MPQRKSDPKSDLEVRVTAKTPPQYASWPANIDDILLGTATKQPTGFVQQETPDEPGRMPRSMGKAYGDFAAEAPMLARSVSNSWEQTDPSGVMHKLVGLAAYHPQMDLTVYTEPPPASRIAHETIHRRQMGNFLTTGDATRAWNPKGTGELAYLDAPGEQQAFKAEELLNARSANREASMKALRDRAAQKR